MAQQDSTKLRWRDEEGADFWWDGATWDIETAREILQSVPHPVVSFDISGAIVELDSVGIQRDALDAADMDFPLIVGWLDSKPLVIDGWHRVAKCSALGLPPFLPAVILTHEESEALRHTWA